MRWLGWERWRLRVSGRRSGLPLLCDSTYLSLVTLLAFARISGVLFMLLPSLPPSPLSSVFLPPSTCSLSLLSSFFFVYTLANSFLFHNSFCSFSTRNIPPPTISHHILFDFYSFYHSIPRFLSPFSIIGGTPRVLPSPHSYLACPLIRTHTSSTLHMYLLPCVISRAGISTCIFLRPIPERVPDRRSDHVAKR